MRSGSRLADDVELVERIATGDGDALGDLHDRYARLLLAIAQRVLGDRGQAEDVVQETLLQVWRQAGRYDARRSSVSTWLVLIARSRAIDRLRSRQVAERAVAAASVLPGRADESPEGADNVLLVERRRRLRAELGNLPPEQREVIELAFYRGLTQREIAQRTGAPLGTVKTRTLLALRKLRQGLGAEIHDLL